MPVFSLNAPQDCDSCYVFRITVGGYTSGSIVFEIGNEVDGVFTSVQTIDTLTADGVYSIDIDPSTFGCTTFNAIRITKTGDSVYKIHGLFVAESCTEPQCSQCFDLADHVCTMLIQYSNNINAFGFDYENFNFTQSIRVEGDLRRPRYPETNNQYTTSRGNNVLVSFNSHEVNEARIDLAPNYVHNALRLARGHREFTINGTRYTPLNQEYAQQHRNDTVLSQARFDVRKYTELNENNNCI